MDNPSATDEDQNDRKVDRGDNTVRPPSRRVGVWEVRDYATARTVRSARRESR